MNREDPYGNDMLIFLSTGDRTEEREAAVHGLKREGEKKKVKMAKREAAECSRSL